MENSSKISKTIGLLLLVGAIALLLPYTALTSLFEYPAVLRQDTATILTKFYAGGSTLIGTWFAFALTGLPLIPAYILLGQRFERIAPLIRVATTLGVIGLVVQMIGLLRWTFVVPVLANAFVNAPDQATQSAAILTFKAIHQFGGVILGEHVGQLFTIAWTLLMTLSFTRLNLFPNWINALGLLSSLIYLLAQAELLATVMPSVPVWGLAGFIGSTLWLVWLMIIGIGFLRMKPQQLSLLN